MPPSPWFHSSALWLVLIILTGCGAANPKTRTQPKPSAVAPHEAPERRRNEPALPPEVIASLQILETVRGLAARGPLKVLELSDEDVVRHVESTFKEQVPIEMARGVGDMLHLLRLVPESFDYAQTLTRAMSKELAGFYDPLTATMYLKRGLEAAERTNTLNHELVHALQDQHYGLRPLTETKPDHSDEASALHALAEGDALSAMLDAALVDQGKTALDLDEEFWAQRVVDASSGDGTIPRVVQRSMTAPYLDGLRFVHALRRRGGWSAVDAAWTSPPKTSEQVLHPEKYFAHEASVPVALPSAPDDSFRLVFRDVLGEQGWRLVLEEHLAPEVAMAAASGWSGDRSVVFRSPTGRALAWSLRYDSPELAEAAWPALREWVSLAAPGPPRSQGTSAATAFVCAMGGAWALGAAQWQQSVVVLALETPSAELALERACDRVERWAARLKPL